MDIDDIYSKETIDEFLTRISSDQLKTVDDIYFICNPAKPEMARKIRIKAKQQLLSWDRNWKALDEVDGGNDPRKFVVDEKKQAQKVYDYYLEHKEEFEDVETLDGQKRLAEATNESGGSLLFHNKKNQKETTNKLAKGFIALAKAMNDGTFEVDALVVLSMRLLKPIHTSRIKISMDRSIDGEFLTKTRDLLATNQGSDLHMKVKMNVASYLNWLKPEGDPFHFVSPLEGSSRQIDRLAEQLAHTNLNGNAKEKI